MTWAPASVDYAELRRAETDAAMFAEFERFGVLQARSASWFRSMDYKDDMGEYL